MSGRDNLRAYGLMLGGIPRSRIDGLLELVGLGERGRDRVGTYSLGMKQRLGVAVALVNDPELLILDEPANGLDPAGIVDMRDLLRRLASGGTSVFVSSHVLGEVQQICDRVAIVDRGELVRLAPVAELVAGSGEFVLDYEDPLPALDLVRAQPWGAAARVEQGALVAPSPTGRGRDLVRFLADAGAWPRGIEGRRRSLEEIFLAATSPAATSPPAEPAPSEAVR